jgi:hypothetical protein
MAMDEKSLSVGAALSEITARIAGIQDKALETHPTEFEEIFQELNRSLNEIDGL